MLKKSQAALEFLTTYAWAFLVILIMIGALAYFGILSPSRLLPERCNFGSEIGCDKSKMIVNNVGGTDNTLAMQLKNNFGEAVVITAGRITTDNTAAGTCNFEINDNPIEGATTYNWASGATLTLHSECSTGATLTEKERIKFNIEIDYYAASAGTTYTKTIFGDIYTTVQ